jgi:hypothetical protein
MNTDCTSMARVADLMQTLVGSSRVLDAAFVLIYNRSMLMVACVDTHALFSVVVGLTIPVVCNQHGAFFAPLPTMSS